MSDESPELQSALHRNSKRKAAALPARVNFSLEDLAAFMADADLINLENQPLRYRFLLIGTNIISILNELR